MSQRIPDRGSKEYNTGNNRVSIAKSPETYAHAQPSISAIEHGHPQVSEHPQSSEDATFADLTAADPVVYPTADLIAADSTSPAPAIVATSVPAPSSN